MKISKYEWEVLLFGKTYKKARTGNINQLQSKKLKINLIFVSGFRLKTGIYTENSDSDIREKVWP